MPFAPFRNLWNLSHLQDGKHSSSKSHSVSHLGTCVVWKSEVQLTD